MNVTLQNLKRIAAGIAICWSAALVLMHGRLLRQHNEEEKKAANILTGNMLQIRCGDNLSTLKDRQCIKRFKWVVVHWVKHKCFGELGITSVNDIDCSVYQYLVFVERVCPLPSNVVEFFSGTLTANREKVDDLQFVASTVQNVSSLYEKLQECGKVCDWMENRVRSMEANWIKASLAFNQTQNQPLMSGIEETEKKLYNTSNTDTFNHKRVRLKILLHMGLLTKQYGLNFGEAALTGGPLGELVQWADLMAALHVLGHEVILSWSPGKLQSVVLPNKDSYHLCQPARTVDLIFTDLVGLEQIRTSMGSLYHYRCLVRVLDVYGTEPQFNHPFFNPDKSSSRFWGGKGLNPAQFFTHFPHSPDNSFLGFVVEKYEGETSLRKRNCAVLYGKRASILSGIGKGKYLAKIYEFYEEIHATMWFKEVPNENYYVGDPRPPPYVINHMSMNQADFLNLLRQSSIYVGLGSPVEGPAALEAVANGVIFLNPKFTPSRQVTAGKPTSRKLDSQNPYAEKQIGEPYVYTVDIRNVEKVEDVLKKIEKRPSPDPYVPHEFTYFGFMERINAYIENQDFCSESVRSVVGSKHIWQHRKARWPPLSLLQARFGQADESCSTTCSRHKMVCEPSFFADLNSLNTFREMEQECTSSRHINPQEDYQKHQSVDDPYKRFDIPCHAPSYSKDNEECFFQTDFLLFSCACTPPSNIIRLCPCREYRKGQMALFP